MLVSEEKIIWGEGPEFEKIIDVECEVCEKKFTGTPKEAFNKGWDVPPYFTGYIKCGNCGIDKTAIWALWSSGYGKE